MISSKHVRLKQCSLVCKSKELKNIEMIIAAFFVEQRFLFVHILSDTFFSKIYEANTLSNFSPVFESLV